MLLRNKPGQGIYLHATTISTGDAKTGDAANIGGFFSLDNGAEASLATAHPTEIGHGIYWQPLAQAETDGEAYAYSWASSTSGVAVRPEAGFTAAVQLADGVTHGGTPGSSTATLAMRAFNATDPTGNAFTVVSGTSFAFEISGGGGAFDIAGEGANPAVAIYGGANSSALGLYGPYATAGPTVVIKDNGAGGDSIQILPANGHGISILASGAGKKAVSLAGDAATDALAIAAGAGSPVDVFDAAGGVRLSADGLDSITATEVSGVPANFREMLRWLYQRFAGRAAKTLSAGTGTVLVKTAAGATATTQAIADDGSGNQTQGIVS